MRPETQLLWAERSVNALANVFPVPDYVNWNDCERLIQQVFAAARIVAESDYCSDVTSRLFADGAGYLFRRAQYEKAESLFALALDHQRRTTGEDHLNFAATLNNLGEMYFAMGRYDDAEPLLRRSLDIRSQRLGSNHIDISITSMNLARLLNAQGRYEEAEQFNIARGSPDANVETEVPKRITARWLIGLKESQEVYDLFLSHNSKDKESVERIAVQLKKIGIRPWLDKWDLAPGDSLRKELEWAIKNISCAALFFGPSDIGNWHILEIDSYLERWASREARMIPVILPNAPSEPEIPLFVRQALWVDMRSWDSDDGIAFYQFVCGIVGRKPGETHIKKLSARVIWDWQNTK